MGGCLWGSLYHPPIYFLCSLRSLCGSAVGPTPSAWQATAWPFWKPKLTFVLYVSPSLSLRVPTCEMRKRSTLPFCLRDQE